MKKVRKKGLSGATAVVTPLIFYCPLEHSAKRSQFFNFRHHLDHFQHLRKNDSV